MVNTILNIQHSLKHYGCTAHEDDTYCGRKNNAEMQNFICTGNLWIKDAKKTILLHHSSIMQLNFEYFQFAVNLFIYQSNGAQSPPHYYLPQGPFQPNPLFNDPIPVLNLSIFLILKQF